VRDGVKKKSCLSQAQRVWTTSTASGWKTHCMYDVPSEGTETAAAAIQGQCTNLFSVVLFMVVVVEYNGKRSNVFDCTCTDNKQTPPQRSNRQPMSRNIFKIFNSIDEIDQSSLDWVRCITTSAICKRTYHHLMMGIPQSIKNGWNETTLPLLSILRIWDSFVFYFDKG
jgi:hypothetical protein